MSADFEQEFYAILSRSYINGEAPEFPVTSHATPHEWQMHERIMGDDQPADRSHGMPATPADGWTGPSGRRYAVGETVSDADLSGGTMVVFNEETGMWESHALPKQHDTSWPTGPFAPPANEHTATWDHPGNPNPYRPYPQPPVNPEDNE
jgi:hypothetical protein